MNRKTGFEAFAPFIQTIQKMGIKHRVDWTLKKEDWQNLITHLGYNMTSLACMSVTIPETNTVFVFFKGTGEFMFMGQNTQTQFVVAQDSINYFRIGEDE